MKIIFLDIDGVLNSEESIIKSYECNNTRAFSDNPHEEHIKWLNYIVEKTNAKIVISSTWRKNSGMVAIWRILNLLGFKGKIIGETPITGDIRGNEIRCWIDRFSNKKDWRFTCDEKYSNNDFKIKKFVIIDDDSDMGNLSHRLVKTNSKTGLTQKEAELAISLLNEELEEDPIKKGYKILERIISDLNKISDEKNIRTSKTFRRKEDFDEIALALSIFADKNNLSY